MKMFSNYDEFHTYRLEISHIKNFIKDGFIKVCDVDVGWKYKNIYEETMFDDHRSWVYLIALNDIVVKVGETGLPLGLKAYDWNGKVTTLKGSKSRLGRLLNGDGTDNYIRQQLHEHLRNGYQVSIWAKRCPINKSKITVAGNTVAVSHTIHKDVEQAILGYFLQTINQLPMLNKAKK